MEIVRYPERNKWEKILERPFYSSKSINKTVKNILKNVKDYGDIALKKYSYKFDNVRIECLSVSQEEILQSENSVDNNLKKAIKIAKSNIEKFHYEQKQNLKVVTTARGVECWQKSVPIEKIGLYIPGGTAPLFSTVLMLGIPAKIAGCDEIILCTPPDENGNINPVILYSANIVGVKKIFKIGGAQAIGAMAYGTGTIPKVYKIFGPGNQYVTAAKQLVSMEQVAIDLPAGPSEVAVIADYSSNPAFVASDLLSQAEHGIDSHVILTTTDEKLINDVLKELEEQICLLPRKEIAEQSLKNSKILLMKDRNEMINIINTYAPEHLIICTKDSDEIAEQIINAGSVFVGSFTPESAGDYISGTNHTLPTNGSAKAYNGLNLDDYVKKITFQKVSRDGLSEIGPAIEIMAEAEKLRAHKNAVEIRLKDINTKS